MHSQSNKKASLVIQGTGPVIISAIAAMFMLHGCGDQGVITDEASYMESIGQWRQNRLERLKSETGWLNLSGLFWLEEGGNSIGSDPSNDVVFPEKAPDFSGILTLENGNVTLEAEPGAGIYYEDSVISEMKLRDDQSEETTYLRHGDLVWYVIRRDDRYGIRLRDLGHPRIELLEQIPSYPVDIAYVAEASLEPFEQPRIFNVATPVEGVTEQYSCPGTLHFRLKGKRLQLYPFSSGNGYFLVIADETTGLETYGGGRFMYATPDSSGRIILDFNKAYNPPCAFSPFATCPLPPRENYLDVAIEAGEKSVHLD